MPAFVVFTKEETVDQSELDTYSASVGESFKDREFKVLAAYGAFDVLEGPPIEGAVLLEFPDIEAARKWYRSDEYQSAARHRFAGAHYRAFIIQGR